MTRDINQRIKETVKVVVESLIKCDYVSLAQMTKDVRLDAAAIRDAVNAYPGTLTTPPPHAYDDMDIVEIARVQPPAYSVWFWLYTLEHGRSDLQLRLRIIDDDSKANIMCFEINDILVP